MKYAALRLPAVGRLLEIGYCDEWDVLFHRACLPAVGRLGLFLSYFHFISLKIK